MRSMIYARFRGDLAQALGEDTARRVWRDAAYQLKALRRAHPDAGSDARMMLLPAAALYRAMQSCAPERALPLLLAYGRRMGEGIARIVHAVTSIPGVPGLLWRHMPALMRHMSSEKKGYRRRIVSESDALVGVDILTCPLHEAAKRIGVPEVALVVCAMDKAYMTGFRHIRYERTTSVAEGAECCDYRLQYDETKG